jgi:hypothetical protein
MKTLAASVLIAAACFSIFAVRIFLSSFFSYPLKLFDSLSLVDYFFFDVMKFRKPRQLITAPSVHPYGNESMKITADQRKS